MVTCPWCGTNYLTFQPNCSNCGGPLQAVDEKTISSAPDENLLIPPSAPRPISDRYVWRLLSSDGWWIVALVFGISGDCFQSGRSRAYHCHNHSFCGYTFSSTRDWIPCSWRWVFIRRYQASQQVVKVLQVGEATRGQIVEVLQDYSVRVMDGFLADTVSISGQWAGL